MKHLLLAEASDLPVDWHTSLTVFVGLIGILVIIYFVFGVVIQWKKLFGRKPSISEELDKLEKKLHSEILLAFDRAYKKADEADLTAAAVREYVDARFEALAKERQESLEGINRAFRDIERGLGRLEGGQSR